MLQGAVGSVQGRLCPPVRRVNNAPPSQEHMARGKFAGDGRLASRELPANSAGRASRTNAGTASSSSPPEGIVGVSRGASQTESHFASKGADVRRRQSQNCPAGRSRRRPAEQLECRWMLSGSCCNCPRRRQRRWHGQCPGHRRYRSTLAAKRHSWNRRRCYRRWLRQCTRYRLVGVTLVADASHRIPAA